jgi:hypothetical protein
MSQPGSANDRLLKLTALRWETRDEAARYVACAPTMVKVQLRTDMVIMRWVGEVVIVVSQ